MMRSQIRSVLVLSLVIVYLCFTNSDYANPSNVKSGKGTRKKKTPEEVCAIFTASDEYTLSAQQSSNLEIDEIDVVDPFTLTMDVFPSVSNHDGILFSCGNTPTFEYYEYTHEYKANTQYIVVEFAYSSLTLTLKAPGMQYLVMATVPKTWPVRYDIGDAQWHSVKVTRRGDVWTVTIDNKASESQIINRTAIAGRTDIQLTNKQAFLGGRPGYYMKQFAGIIKNVNVNGQAMKLRVKKKQGRVAIQSCTSEDIKGAEKEWKKRYDEKQQTELMESEFDPALPFVQI